MAVGVQRELRTRRWDEEVEVRVRVGMHSGLPTQTDDNYIGLPVHAAARICAAAHGGQILVSQDTRDGPRGALVEAVRFRGLGHYRLRGLPEPVSLYQVERQGPRGRGSRRRVRKVRAEGPGHSPVTPSMRSRSRSAWPLWRAYSPTSFWQVPAQGAPVRTAGVVEAEVARSPRRRPPSLAPRPPSTRTTIEASHVEVPLGSAVVVRPPDEPSGRAAARAPTPVHPLHLGQVADESEQGEAEGRAAAPPASSGESPAHLA